MLSVFSSYVPALALWLPGSFLVEFVNKAWCVSSFTTGVMPESGIAPPVPLCQLHPLYCCAGLCFRFVISVKYSREGAGELLAFLVGFSFSSRLGFLHFPPSLLLPAVPGQSFPIGSA